VIKIINKYTFTFYKCTKCRPFIIIIKSTIFITLISVQFRLLLLLKIHYVYYTYIYVFIY